jgi:two-component system, OmpR family, response regulator
MKVPRTGDLRGKMKNDESDSRPAILVVDDEPDFLDSVRLFLTAASNHDFEIITTSQPKQIADILNKQAGRLKMILLDMHMPECSGFDVIRWIRAHPKLANLPILMLSGDHMGRRCVAETADPHLDFLLKPFDPEVLYYRIKRSDSFCKAN